MTRTEVLEKIMDMAYQLSNKFDYDLDNEMQELCIKWNLEHLENEEEQICIAWDEEELNKFYVEWNTFYYAK